MLNILAAGVSNWRDSRRATYEALALTRVFPPHCGWPRTLPGLTIMLRSVLFDGVALLHLEKGWLL